MVEKLATKVLQGVEIYKNPAKLLEKDLIGEDKIKNVADIALGLNQILKKIVGPILSAIGIAAIIYAIYLGVMYAKAESAESRKTIQGRLIGACIGAVIIVVGATVCFAVNWSAVYFNFSDSKHKYVDDNDDNLCDWCGQETGHTIHTVK